MGHKRLFNCINLGSIVTGAFSSKQGKGGRKFLGVFWGFFWRGTGKENSH